MQAIRVRLFGTPALQGSAGTEPLLPERMTQLASVLAARGDWVTRDQLIGLLWPELDDEAARRNLRKLLFRARRQPWFEGLETRTNALRWRVDSDLHDFETAVAQSDWERAVEAYSSAFCDGFEHKATESFVEWLRFERNRLLAAYRSAAARRVVQLADDASAREGVARQWLALDPLDEDALATLADALREQERGGEAQRVVGDFTQRVAREIGVAPSVRVRALDSGSRARRDSAARLDADFVGRRAELLEVQTLLAREECRVLTITGPGGIGKSRLARAVVAHAAPQFESASWIGLEDLTDVAQVAPRMAGVLGVTLTGTADPLAQVSEALHSKRDLLVFDNSEHLAGIAPLVAHLAQACPRLKLLLTSRARLAIAGEWLLPLAGLPVPEPDENEPDVQRTFDAVKLFELRARAAAPSFDAARTAIDVAALVRSLEGAPLAIELAAAWVRLLPVIEIRREIERSIDLLEGTAHAGRHRSVRASFEHSWGLLTAIEQRCLAHLSVFMAPFTREAAEQVAQASLPVLAALADKSLLRADGDGRFSFHALMRECAHEKMVDPEASLARHADYFVRTLANPRTSWSGQRAELQLIETQLEDYRIAWQRTMHRGEAKSLETMALPLTRFFVVKGRLAEGIKLIEQALQSLPSAPRMTVAVLHHALGTLQYRHGDLVVAAETLQRALELYRRLRAPAEQVRQCIVILSMTAWTRGDPRTARRYFEEVLRLARADGDDIGSAQALNGLALCARALGDYDRALASHEEALSLLRHANNPLLEASVLHDLGSLQFTLRRFADAQQTLQRALALCEANALTVVRQFCLLSLAFAEIELRQFDSAQAHVEQTVRGEQTTGESLVSAMVQLALARINTRRGELAAAASKLHDGMERARAAGSAPTQMVALNFAAEWLAARSERDRAAALWTFVASHSQAEEGDREEARRALQQLRFTTAESSGAAQAAKHFQMDSLVDALIAELAS